MRVGLQLPSFSWPGGTRAIAATLATTARRAEEHGFASLWLMDHLFQLPEDTGWGGPGEPMLEAWTALGFVARATDRIELGPLVANVNTRPPGLLVKAATTLDVLAGGRTWLGLGAGWYERESRGLGIHHPARRERFERLEETLRIAHAMFAGDRSPFVGRHYALTEPINVPPPIGPPGLGRPRILVGGGGERRTLRLVAELADACNILVPDPGESRRKVDVLKRHCDAVGRDVSQIETTALLEVDLRRERPADIVARLRDQASEGIGHVIVNLPDAHVAGRLETLGREVIPAVATLDRTL
jgi:F420-dependent oxidoreductase-like protein